MTPADHANTVREALLKLQRLQRTPEGFAHLDALQTQAEEAVGAIQEMWKAQESQQVAEAERAAYMHIAEQWKAECDLAKINWKNAADQAETLEADNTRLREQIEYADGVLSRDPFDDTQRDFAAQILRAALAGGDTCV